MNKTLTINISGIIFHIEEDAYEKLSRYLATIKSYFSHTEGGNEIMSDIEARIAELLQEKLNPGKQVILLGDVDYALNTMGRPEDFGAEQSSTQSSAENENTAGGGSSIRKRLYRDPDDKVLGGVCSGIGQYFGIDPVWLRIALALLLVFAGTGFLLYLILWIAIPEAKTTAEKLAMKGEPADINNISRTVKEEAEQLKKRMQKYGEDVNNQEKFKTGAEKFVDFFVTIFMGIGKFILRFLGGLLLVFGVLFFIGVFSSALGFTVIGNIALNDWAEMFLLEGGDFYLGAIGLFLFLIVPAVGMIFGGIKLLFKVNYYNRWMNLGAGIVWLIGLFMILYVGIRTAKDFNKTAKVREKVELKSEHPVLNLRLNEVPLNYAELNTSDPDHEGERDYRHHRGESNYAIGVHDGERYLIGHAQLNIIRSQSDEVELVIVKEAKAGSKAVANDRARNIEYHAVQQDSSIFFDNVYKVNNADKFRFQDVNVVLKLPVGQVIYLDNSVENLIYDIENVTNTYDGDMIGRRWEMTEAGLECVDCDGLDEVEGRRDKVININAGGVHIKSRSSKVKVDSSGIRVNGKDARVIIDENGIEVKTK